MKTTEIKNMTQAELVERVQELETQLAAYTGDGNTEGITPPKVAAHLWTSIEQSLKYKKWYDSDSYFDIKDQVTEDLALLGRISQEVTFAHICRRSTADFGAEAGEPLSDDQYEHVFYFIDRISSALFILRDKFTRLHREECERNNK